MEAFSATATMFLPSINYMEYSNINVQVAAAAAAAAVVATSAEQVHWTWKHAHSATYFSLFHWLKDQRMAWQRETTRSHFIIPVLFKHFSLLSGCQAYTARWILCAYLDLHKHAKKWYTLLDMFVGVGTARQSSTKCVAVLIAQQYGNSTWL